MWKTNSRSLTTYFLEIRLRRLQDLLLFRIHHSSLPVLRHFWCFFTHKNFCSYFFVLLPSWIFTCCCFSFFLFEIDKHSCLHFTHFRFNSSLSLRANLPDSSTFTSLFHNRFRLRHSSDTCRKLSFANLCLALSLHCIFPLCEQLLLSLSPLLQGVLRLSPQFSLRLSHSRHAE